MLFQRKNAKFWTNDTNTSIVPDAPDSDSGESIDSEEKYADLVMSGKLRNKKATGGSDDDGEEQKNIVLSVDISDMDYLKSKVAWNDSDSDSDSDSDADSAVGSQRTKSVNPKKTQRSAEEEGDNDDQEAVDHLSGKVLTWGEKYGPSAAGQTSEGSEEDEEEDDSGRLFVRNLPFTCSEEELREAFAAYGDITSVHLPLDGEKRSKGYGFVQFLFPENSERALGDLDGTAFQGRVLHVIKAKRTKEKDPEKSEKSVAKNSKLSAYQQKREEERKKMAGKKDGNII